MNKTLVGLLAALALILTACGGYRVLPDDEARAFADEVDSMSENLLRGLSNHDYAAYTRDMDGPMLEVSTETHFDEVYNTLIGILGGYVSSEMTQVLEQKQGGVLYRAVVYDAEFEQEAHVTVRVVYNVSGDRPLVSGLWFDSPRLRNRNR